MCLNCGCGQLDERHGNQANLIADDVRRAAGATGQDLETTLGNMRASLGAMSDGTMSDGAGADDFGAVAGGRGWATGSAEAADVAATSTRTER